MTLITSNFAGGPANGLGSSWTDARGSVDAAKGWKRTADGKAIAGSTDTLVAVHATDPGSPDQFVEAVLDGTGASVGLFLCATAPTGPQDATIGGYFARHNGSNVGIFRSAAGNSAVVKLADAAHSRAADQVLRVVRDGAAIIAFVDGVEVVRASDTDRSGGLVGLRNSGTAGVTLAGFRAGTLADMAELDGAPPPPPSQVTGLRVQSPATKRLRATWSPTDRATGYQATFSAMSSENWAPDQDVTGTSADLTTSTVAGYQVRVRAFSAAGPGPWSAGVQLPADGAGALVGPEGPVSQDPDPAPTPALGAAWRGLVFNRAGEPMLAGGELLHQLRTSVYGKAGAYVPPPWLTLSGDVAVGQAEGGYLSLKSTSSVPASVALTPELASTDVGAVWVELDHARFPTKNDGAWSITVGSAAVGVRAGQSGGDTYTYLANGSQRTDARMGHMGSTGHQRRRIGFLVSLRTKEAWLMDGLQVTGYRDCTQDWADGPMPVTVSTSGGAQLRAARVTITTYL